MGLGEPQRALLDYYADYHTLRLESSPQAGQCQWLLVQTLHDQLPAFAATLTPLRSFQRRAMSGTLPPLPAGTAAGTLQTPANNSN